MAEAPCSPGSQQVSIPVTGVPLGQQMGTGMQAPLRVGFLSRDTLLIKAGLGDGREGPCCRSSSLPKTEHKIFYV